MGISQLFNTLGDDTKNAISPLLDSTLIRNANLVEAILCI